MLELGQVQREDLVVYYSQYCCFWSGIVVVVAIRVLIVLPDSYQVLVAAKPLGVGLVVAGPFVADAVVLIILVDGSGVLAFAWQLAAAVDSAKLVAAAEVHLAGVVLVGPFAVG
jgi:hypothetical protein